MSGWSNQESLLFLEFYQSYPCIWDPNHVHNKDKKRVADAWNHLSESIGKPVKELKNKKEIMMATFRKLLRRRLDSVRAGAEPQNVYQPVWFAYELMESFLMPIYLSKDVKSSQSQQIFGLDDIECSENGSSPLQDNDDIKDSFKVTASTSKSDPRDSAEKLMASAFEHFTNVLDRKQTDQNTVIEEDDCDLYAKLLAKKLRKLPNNERTIMMHRLDGCFIDNINQNSIINNNMSSTQYNLDIPTIPNVTSLKRRLSDSNEKTKYSAAPFNNDGTVQKNEKIEVVSRKSDIIKEWLIKMYEDIDTSK